MLLMLACWLRVSPNLTETGDWEIWYQPLLCIFHYGRFLALQHRASGLMNIGGLAFGSSLCTRRTSARLALDGQGGATGLYILLYGLFGLPSEEIQLACRRESPEMPSAAARLLRAAVAACLPPHPT